MQLAGSSLGQQADLSHVRLTQLPGRGCGLWGGGPGCGGELSSHGRAAVVPSRAQPLRPFLIWRACVLPVEFSRCSER